jgi:hypothetical protein
MFKSLMSQAELAIALGKVIKRFRDAPIKQRDKERQEWIKSVSNKIIDLLEKEVVAFNKDNPTDKIKEQELLKTVQTTLQKIMDAFKMIKGS